MKRALALAALLGCHHAPPPAGTQVPFELLANAIFVTAKINGHGPFLFALDTGSCCSVFASELVDELGMKPTGENNHGTGAGTSSAKLGLVKGHIAFELDHGLVLATEDANTVSMAGLWPLLGKKFYGNLGKDVLEHSVVRIDYDHRTITFYAGAYPGTAPILDAKLVMGYDPQLPGAVAAPGTDAFAAGFTLDTGAGGTIVTSPLVSAHHLLDHVHTLSSPSHGLGNGQSNDVIGRLDAVAIGPFLLHAPVLALSTDTVGSLANAAFSVNLGGNLLRRFTVTIDYPHNRVMLEPGAEFDAPFLADASGLVLRAEGPDYHRFVVTAIAPGSPAADAQLQPDDVIGAIDGKPASAFALWQLQELLRHAGTRVALSIVRDGKTAPSELALRALL
jgi:hypothetical protein